MICSVLRDGSLKGLIYLRRVVFGISCCIPIDNFVPFERFVVILLPVGVQHEVACNGEIKPKFIEGGEQCKKEELYDVIWVLRRGLVSDTRT